MKNKYTLGGAIAITLLVSNVMALVPPPPVNQLLGIPDTTFGQFSEPEYCVQCHTFTPHHEILDAQDGNCSVCHGSLIDDIDDGHYIPSYKPSFMTPDTSYKVKNETSGKKWGGCEACHEGNIDTTSGEIVVENFETHHNLGNVSNNCDTCHFSDGTGALNITLNIRQCENCHSVKSLHNIQYDYPNTSGIPGYGHIGTNWDCNGCHAFWDAGADLVVVSSTQVDKEISIYNTNIGDFAETDCWLSGCHNDSIANVYTHHLLVQDKGFGCLDCHEINPDSGLNFDFKSCFACHYSQNDCFRMVDESGDGVGCDEYYGSYTFISEIEDEVNDVGIINCLACHDLPHDKDSDGVEDPYDNCQMDANPEQEDLDEDGFGDVCDEDDDDDKVPDSKDNCPINSNSDQSDSDYDGIGDACDQYYGSDTVVSEIKDKVNESIDIITSLPRLPGDKGMINKLQNIVKIVGNAVTSYQEETITHDEYIAQLFEATDLLMGFDNQLEAKADNNQIRQDKADLLKSLSAQIRACIESLIDNS